ncbi:hypothetical protein DdX_02052 [Ditylenchus destructor]|uniref:Uncharacterized protein n=1 Tax=Ditylenchus destructor TaxID=166010 RepID=A0AAD4NAB5_9BILA|nr:hypothetical protein DdX_02052 [Ditylenchus destructor]
MTPPSRRSYETVSKDSDRERSMKYLMDLLPSPIPLQSAENCVKINETKQEREIIIARPKRKSRSSSLVIVPRRRRLSKKTNSSPKSHDQAENIEYLNASFGRTSRIFGVESPLAKEINNDSIRTSTPAAVRFSRRQRGQQPDSSVPSREKSMNGKGEPGKDNNRSDLVANSSRLSDAKGIEQKDDFDESNGNAISTVTATDGIFEETDLPLSAKSSSPDLQNLADASHFNQSFNLTIQQKAVKRCCPMCCDD